MESVPTLRLNRVAAHLSPQRPPPPPRRLHLVALELGDAPAAWEAAGFRVERPLEPMLAEPRRARREYGVVRLPGLAVVLSGNGGGLVELWFGVVGPLPRAPRIAGVATTVVSMHNSQGAWWRADCGCGRCPCACKGRAGCKCACAGGAAGAGGSCPIHANGASSIAELVLFSLDLPAFLSQLAAAGVRTHRGKPLREMGGGLAMAAFFFPLSTGRRLRLLAVGAMQNGDKPGKVESILQKVGVKSAWMLPKTSAATELTGALVTTASLRAARDCLPMLGAEREAVQGGRRIATARNVAGVTGTLALLSGDADVFKQKK